MVDQFEDTLRDPSRSNIDTFLRAMTIIQLGSIPNVHFLIAYRGDAESRLGELWQQISGDAQGLPRLYLNPLSREGAMAALHDIFRCSSVELDDALLQLIVEHIAAESAEYLQVDGIYPPYIQIVSESLIKFIQMDNEGTITHGLYAKLGGARQVIGQYLFQRISELGGHRAQAEQVLTALVSASGSRITSSVDEIAVWCGVPRGNVQGILALLVERRLLREVSEGTYEIIHDYLSELIREKLLRQSGQTEAKQVVELLALRAAAMLKSGYVFSHEELLTLYQHRERIQPSDEQLRLLVASGLRDRGPFWYWAHGDENKWLTVVRQLTSHLSTPIRAEAYFALGRALGARSRRDLEGGLRDQDPSVRKRVIDTLAVFCGKEALPSLETAFDDPGPTVAKEAVRAAAYLLIEERMSRARSPEWRTLDIHTDEVSYHVLSEHYGRRIVPMFCRILEEDGDVVPYIARLAAGKVPDQIKALLRAARSQHREKALAAIEAIGDKDIVPELASQLPELSVDLREKAVKAAIGSTLWYKSPALEQAAVYDRLSRLSNEKIAVRAFGEAFGRRSIPFLLEMLRDSEDAAIELARVGGENIVSQVMDLLRDKRRGSGLIHSKEENCLVALIAVALKEDFPWYFDAICFNEEVMDTSLFRGREELYDLLTKLVAKFFDRSMTGVLRDLLGHQNNEARAMAIQILSYVEPEGMSDVLRRGLEDEDRGVINMTARVIARLGETQFLDRLNEIWASSGGLGYEIDEAIGKLLISGGVSTARKGIVHASTEVRKAAIRAIGKKGISELIPELRGMLSDSNQQIRVEAGAALAELGTEEDLVPLLEMAAAARTADALRAVAVLDRRVYCPFEWMEIPAATGSLETLRSLEPRPWVHH